MTIPNRTVCVYILLFLFFPPLARIGRVTASVWLENCGKIQSAIRARSCGLGTGFFLSSFSTLALNAEKENSKRTGVGESSPWEKRGRRGNAQHAKIPRTIYRPRAIWHFVSIDYLASFARCTTDRFVRYRREKRCRIGEG